MVEPPSWVVRRRDRSSPFFGVSRVFEAERRGRESERLGFMRLRYCGGERKSNGSTVI